MNYTFLSGGTGTPKLLQGFRELVSDSNITVICNSGDDYTWNGLYICPDLDTILYLFSHQLDLKKFWGVKNETFTTLESLNKIGGEDTWFNVGDRDLALHIYRSNNLQNQTLTQITKNVCKEWRIETTILPMSDNQIQTRIYSDRADYHFQEYFVKLKTDINVQKVLFKGLKDKTTSEVREQLDKSNSIIIGPSNPITSIGPILSISEIQQLLIKYRTKVILISPLKGSQAFSGPTVQLMNAMNIDPSPLGLAEHYKDYVSKIIFHHTDQNMKSALEDLDIEPIFTSIELTDLNQKKKLAGTILDFI